MSTNQSHMSRIGANCFDHGLDETQTDAIVSQFADVLTAPQWDAFWEGYYGALLVASEIARYEPIDEYKVHQWR